MKYTANPVQVEAFVITAVGEQDENGAKEIRISDPNTGSTMIRMASAAMLSRILPEVGDYWVVQSDSYEYLNPKQVFERKYSPSELKVVQ